MTKTAEEIAAEIAAGLTEAQRRTIAQGRIDYGRGYWPLFNALTSKGLIRGPWGYLTPLGEQVRNFLTEKQS